jgi:hypothetical protein
MIKIVIAGDKNFEAYVEKGTKVTRALGYEVLVYDLGGLGYGKPFIGRVSDAVNAKIPCKPHIILDALDSVADNDYLVWLDADALIVDKIDEIQADYDIGVTVRQPKAVENMLPINAGIVFIKKTPAAIKFIKKWIDLCNVDISDQPPLNKLSAVVCADIGSTVMRDGVKIKVYPCATYNNFYFAKKDKPGNKIKHYKSKLRHLYPLEKK